VILPGSVTILCPEECTCDTEGYQVSCSGTSFKLGLLTHLTDTRILRVSYNEITSLEKDSFVSLTELEELYIYNCGLETIELGAFNGLTELRRLSIWNNEISEITPGTFENMNSLENLGLMNNRLEHLDSNVFKELFKLKRLTLSGNQLQYLNPDMFLGLPNLKQLDLKENWALQVPTDRNFINSRSLSRLDISDCNISSVSVQTFANVSALKWLDLSSNNLRTVDINILIASPKLSRLYLYGNPLQCDCQLQEVWRFCQNFNIQTETEGRPPECDTPSELKGMWWGVLEKKVCLEGNI
jgi:Leucine-rich repeat (LRR) protein